MVLTTRHLVAAAAVTAATIGLAAGIQAQTGGQPTAEQLRARQNLEKQLGITTTQKTKIEAIEKKYRPQMSKIQEQMIKLQRQMITLGLTADKEIQGVLTQAQRDKIKQLQQAQIKQTQSGAAAKPAAGR